MTRKKPKPQPRFNIDEVDDPNYSTRSALNMRIISETRDQLERLARADRRTLTGTIEFLILEEMKRRKKSIG